VVRGYDISFEPNTARAKGRRAVSTDVAEIAPSNVLLDRIDVDRSVWPRLISR
jgi:hypothetical protein